MLAMNSTKHLLDSQMLNQVLLPFGALRRRVDSNPVFGAVLVGLLLGFMSVALSCAVLGTLTLLLPASQWGLSAGAELYTRPEGFIIFYAIVIAPLLETLEGQVLPIELARRLRASSAICVLLSGIVFGVGHYLNGGLAHGITAFFTGLILGYGYVALRSHGLWPAYVASSTAHAMHNTLAIVAISRLFPEWS
jgi:hypothetical protein